MREPVVPEEAEHTIEPQPSTSGAGHHGPPTRVGAGMGGGGDDSGDEGGSLPKQPLWMERFSEWWNIPIEDLNFSMRAYNCLRRSGIMTVGQILEKTAGELMELRNFGRKCYDELRDKLDEMSILPAPPPELDEPL